MQDLLIAGCVEAAGSLFWVTIFADLFLKVFLKVCLPPQPFFSYRRTPRQDKLLLWEGTTTHRCFEGGLLLF